MILHHHSPSKEEKERKKSELDTQVRTKKAPNPPFPASHDLYLLNYPESLQEDWIVFPQWSQNSFT